jgi:hypothetical protein
LVHLHAVEKTFHYDDRALLRGRGTVHVKEDCRLGESRRDSVARRGLIHGAAAIGDQLSVSVVDRNDQSPVHQSWSRVETDAKLKRCFFGNPTIGQIGMRAIDASQFEVQGQRNPSSFRNQFRLISYQPRLARPAGHVLQLLGCVVQRAALHRRHKVQHSSAGAACEAMKNIAR